MLQLSEIIIHHPDIDDFQDLLKLVGQHGADGQVLLNFDLKPDYRNTPRDWRDRLEHAFLFGGKR